MYVYPLERLYEANINLGLLLSTTLPPPPLPSPAPTPTPSLLQDSSSWLPSVTVRRAVRYWPFQGRMWSSYKARSFLIRQLRTSLCILTPSSYNLRVGQWVTHTLRASALAQATTRSYHIIGYPGTLAKHIGIINSVTIYPAAPYKVRMEVTTVDLYACRKQGLVAIVGTTWQRYRY